MSAEDFQLIDNTINDNLISKRDFAKKYHQRSAQLNEGDKNVEFVLESIIILIA